MPWSFLLASQRHSSFRREQAAAGYPRPGAGLAKVGQRDKGVADLVRTHLDDAQPCHPGRCAAQIIRKSARTTPRRSRRAIAVGAAASRRPRLARCRVLKRPRHRRPGAAYLMFPCRTRTCRSRRCSGRPYPCRSASTQALRCTETAVVWLPAHPPARPNRAHTSTPRVSAVVGCPHLLGWG